MRASAIALRRLQRVRTPRACIVCHGGTVCAILDSFGTEKRGFYDWQPAFGHGWRVRLTAKDGPVRIEVLESV